MRLPLTRERREPRDRPEVLLEVAARHHLLAEELVERDPRGQDRHVLVIETVRENDERRGIGYAIELERR